MVSHEGGLEAVNRRSVPNMRGQIILLWDSAWDSVVLTLGLSSGTPTPDQNLTFNVHKAVGNLVHQG